MVAMLEFPKWLSPEIIPGLPFRWYGLMYLIAFSVAWLLFRRESKRLRAPWTEDEAANFFIWSIVGILLGGRLAGTLIYEPSNYYWIKPWFIFWPFDESGAFVGFQGMSYHGGFVGLIVATLIWCKVNRWRALGQGQHCALGDALPECGAVFSQGTVGAGSCTRCGYPLGFDERHGKFAAASFAIV